MIVDVFTPYVCVLVVGFHNINQTGVFTMIAHRIEFRKNEAGEIHCFLIVCIPLVRLHFHTRLVGGRDNYDFEINAFEIELILKYIL